MDNTKYIALSRQMALWKQMNTSGYKQDDAVFSSYLVQTPEATGFGRVPVYFTQDYGQYQDFREGAIVNTGNTFDLASRGDVFFAIETNQGEMYTKKGSFTLDANGQLVTMEGQTVLSENNEPLFFAPGEKDISIASNGDVTTENGTIGRLKLVKFADNRKLMKVADTMFRNTADNAMTVGPEDAQVVQGALEQSNVNSITEMTKMIKLQRSYEIVQSMIDEEHERLGVRTAAIYRITGGTGLTNTNNSLDLAIQGRGYFQIELPEGKGIAYTRDGAFQKNGDGVIVTHDGYIVQPEITIPDDATEVYINNSGEVWVKQDGETDEVNVGQLELATFVNEAGLEAMGQNLLLETQASGAPIVDNPDVEGFGSILQGYLETSNVNPVSEITELVSAQRAYEMNSKIIQTSDQMLNTITQLR